MALTNADRCCICAHPLNSTACPHPWAKPFTEWSTGLMQQLRSILRPDRHPGS